MEVRFILFDKENNNRRIPLSNMWICQEYDSLCFAPADKLEYPFPYGKFSHEKKDSDDISRYDVFIHIIRDDGSEEYVPIKQASE